jgi:hypothetical protein
VTCLRSPRLDNLSLSLSISSKIASAFFLAFLAFAATIDRLGLPGVSHLLHVDPDRLAGDRGDGAGGGLLHLSVEQPQGICASGRERVKHGIHIHGNELDHSGVVLCLFSFNLSSKVETLSLSLL